MKQGKESILEWFGEGVFWNLKREGTITECITPKIMLDHLIKTYARADEFRECFNTSKTAFERPFNAREGIHDYFMKMQDAMDEAALLGRPFSDAHAMDQAINQFINFDDDETKKAEKRWIEKNPPHERTWATFQDWWTVEMQRQLKKSKSKKEAHEALLEHVSTVEAQMAVQHQAYQAELQSIQFQQALQASTPGSQQSIVDDSTVSDLTTEFQNMKMAFNSMIRDPGVCPTLPTSSISTPSST